MADVAIFWDPLGFELDSLRTNSLISITDGDTPYIRMSIRMLSIDTPEVHYPNNSDPATAGARLVVSERGDILSPKYAPEMMAPAVRPRFRFCAVATPTRAMPMVDAVVHDDPVASDTKQQMMQAAT